MVNFLDGFAHKLYPMGVFDLHVHTVQEEACLSTCVSNAIVDFSSLKYMKAASSQLTNPHLLFPRSFESPCASQLTGLVPLHYMPAPNRRLRA